MYNIIKLLFFSFDKGNVQEIEGENIFSCIVECASTRMNGYWVRPLMEALYSEILTINQNYQLHDYKESIASTTYLDGGCSGNFLLHTSFKVFHHQ
jgi:hypothetical protein